MENFDKIKEEITKLQTSFAAISKKYKEIKGDGIVIVEDCGPSAKDLQDMMYHMMDNISTRISYIWDEVYRISDALYTHKSKGHWPQLSASQIQKALNACKLDGDFSVEKPVIYATTNGRKTNFIAEYKKPVK